MIGYYIDILAFLFTAMMVGLTSAQIAKALDFGMDYGHWLDWLRLSKVRQAAQKVDLSKWFDSEVEKRLDTMDFGDRLEMMDELYWAIASRYKPLTLWLCSKCLSHRINFIFSTIIIGAVWFVNGVHFIHLGFYLISLTFNQIFVSR